jgi:hypothetical protein
MISQSMNMTAHVICIMELSYSSLDQGMSVLKALYLFPGFASVLSHGTLGTFRVTFNHHLPKGFNDVGLHIDLFRSAAQWSKVILHKLIVAFIEE